VTIGVLLAAAAGSAQASTSALSVSSAWQKPDRVHAVTGLLAGTHITYTVTDTSHSDSTLYDVVFSDLLPSAGGVQFYPTSTGTFANCGSSHSVTLGGGFTRVKVSGLTVTNGTACTVTFGAVGTTPGTGPDDITGLAYATSPTGLLQQGGSATPSTLQVLQSPAVDFGLPANRGSYAYGRPLMASYSCAQPDFTSGITGCYGYDDVGHEIDPGSYLDTLSVGSHTLTVFATNIGDGFGETDLTYYVRPFAIRRVRSRVRKPLRFSVHLPIQGLLVATLLDGTRGIAELSTQVARAGTVTPALRLNRRGRHLLAAAHRRALRNARRKARSYRRKHPLAHRHRIRVIPTLGGLKLRVSFRPSNAAVLDSPYFTLFNAPLVTVTRGGVRLH